MNKDIKNDFIEERIPLVLTFHISNFLRLLLENDYFLLQAEIRILDTGAYYGVIELATGINFVACIAQSMPVN